MTDDSDPGRLLPGPDVDEVGPPVEPRRATPEPLSEWERERSAWTPPPVPPHQSPAQWGPPSATQRTPPTQAGWGPPPGPGAAQNRPAPGSGRAQEPVLPVQQTRYPQFWRAPGLLPWMSIVATLLLGGAFIALSTVTVLVALSLDGFPTMEELEALTQGSLTPEVVFANSLGIALVLPCAFLIVRLCRQRPGFLSSVVGRFRWGFFWKAVGVTAAVFAVHTTVSILIDGPESLGLAVHDYTWWLLVGLMLVTPFQAAAEEYMLRGLVFRTVGSWFAAPMVAALVGGLVNTLIFMGLHASTDVWLNVVYFSMGAIGSWLVWRTGGLEGAVAIHVVNNMIGMAILPFQDMEAQFDRSSGVGGPELLLQVLTMLLAGLLIAWLAKRSGLAATGPVGAAERDDASRT